MGAMTKTEFTAYANTLLKDHAIIFGDEENDLRSYSVGGDGYELMRDVFNVENSSLTMIKEGNTLGGITLINEYDHKRECPVVEVYNYSDACRHLIS